MNIFDGKNYISWRPKFPIMLNVNTGFTFLIHTDLRCKTVGSLQGKINLGQNIASKKKKNFGGAV